MHEDDRPDIIFSDLSREVEIDGHRFMVEIFRTDIDPGWAMTVENVFGTQTVFDTPPFLGDHMAWRAFEKLIAEEGVRALYTDKELHRLTQ